MKIEEQVLSREQMKHLQELGVDTSDASMYWVRAKRIIGKQRNNVLDNEMGKWSLSLSKSIVHSVDWAVESVPTYTIDDLIEKLPEDLRFKCQGSNYSFSKNWDSLSFGYERIIPHSNNLIEGLFTLLCWVAENHKELL